VAEMAYVVAATWRAREGEEDAIVRILEAVVPLARGEPACRLFQAHRSADNPREFFLYEQYDDEAGFQAHLATDAFQTHVLDDAVPRLEHRARVFYITMD